MLSRGPNRRGLTRGQESSLARWVLWGSLDVGAVVAPELGAEAQPTVPVSIRCCVVESFLERVEQGEVPVSRFLDLLPRLLATVFGVSRDGPGWIPDVEAALSAVRGARLQALAREADVAGAGSPWAPSLLEPLGRRAVAPRSLATLQAAHDNHLSSPQVLVTYRRVRQAVRRAQQTRTLLWTASGDVTSALRLRLTSPTTAGTGTRPPDNPPGRSHARSHSHGAGSGSSERGITAGRRAKAAKLHRPTLTDDRIMLARLLHPSSQLLQTVLALSGCAAAVPHSSAPVAGPDPGPPPQSKTPCLAPLGPERVPRFTLDPSQLHRRARDLLVVGRLGAVRSDAAHAAHHDRRALAGAWDPSDPAAHPQRLDGAAGVLGELDPACARRATLRTLTAVELYAALLCLGIACLGAPGTATADHARATPAFGLGHDLLDADSSWSHTLGPTLKTRRAAARALHRKAVRRAQRQWGQAPGHGEAAPRRLSEQVRPAPLLPPSARPRTRASAGLHRTQQLLAKLFGGLMSPVSGPSPLAGLGLGGRGPGGGAQPSCLLALPTATGWTDPARASRLVQTYQHASLLHEGLISFLLNVLGHTGDRLRLFKFLWPGDADGGEVGGEVGGVVGGVGLESAFQAHRTWTADDDLVLELAEPAALPPSTYVLSSAEQTGLDGLATAFGGGPRALEALATPGGAGPDTASPQDEAVVPGRPVSLNMVWLLSDLLVPCGARPALPHTRAHAPVRRPLATRHHRLAVMQFLVHLLADPELVQSPPVQDLVSRPWMRALLPPWTGALRWRPPSTRPGSSPARAWLSKHAWLSWLSWLPKLSWLLWRRRPFWLTYELRLALPGPGVWSGQRYRAWPAGAAGASRLPGLRGGGTVPAVVAGDPGYLHPFLQLRVLQGGTTPYTAAVVRPVVRWVRAALAQTAHDPEQRCAWHDALDLGLLLLQPWTLQAVGDAAFAPLHRPALLSNAWTPYLVHHLGLYAGIVGDVLLQFDQSPDFLVGAPEAQGSLSRLLALDRLLHALQWDAAAPAVLGELGALAASPGPAPTRGRAPKPIRVPRELAHDLQLRGLDGPWEHAGAHRGSGWTLLMPGHGALASDLAARLLSAPPSRQSGSKPPGLPAAAQAPQDYRPVPVASAAQSPVRLALFQRRLPRARPSWVVRTLRRLEALWLSTVALAAAHSPRRGARPPPRPRAGVPPPRPRAGVPPPRQLAQEVLEAYQPVVAQLYRGLLLLAGRDAEARLGDPLVFSQLHLLSAPQTAADAPARDTACALDRWLATAAAAAAGSRTAGPDGTVASVDASGDESGWAPFQPWRIPPGRGQADAACLTGPASYPAPGTLGYRPLFSGAVRAAAYRLLLRVRAAQAAHMAACPQVYRQAMPFARQDTLDPRLWSQPAPASAPGGSGSLGLGGSGGGHWLSALADWFSGLAGLGAATATAPANAAPQLRTSIYAWPAQVLPRIWHLDHLRMAALIRVARHLEAVFDFWPADAPAVWPQGTAGPTLVARLRRADRWIARDPLPRALVPHSDLASEDGASGSRSGDDSTSDGDEGAVDLVEDGDDDPMALPWIALAGQYPEALAATLPRHPVPVRCPGIPTPRRTAAVAPYSAYRFLVPTSPTPRSPPDASLLDAGLLLLAAPRPAPLPPVPPYAASYAAAAHERQQLGPAAQHLPHSASPAVRPRAPSPDSAADRPAGRTLIMRSAVDHALHLATTARGSGRIRYAPTEYRAVTWAVVRLAAALDPAAKPDSPAVRRARRFANQVQVVLVLAILATVTVMFLGMRLWAVLVR